MNYIIILLLIIIIFVLICVKNNQEYFSVGHGGGFGQFYKPIPKCNSNNNCFPGYYFRSQSYQNMCEPCEGLLKTKRSNNNNCLRSLNK